MSGRIASSRATRLPDDKFRRQAIETGVRVGVENASDEQPACLSRVLADRRQRGCAQAAQQRIVVTDNGDISWDDTPSSAEGTDNQSPAFPGGRR